MLNSAQKMSDLSTSITSSPSSPSSQTTERTNSLIVAQLPQSFFHPLVINVLRDHFATYGEINQWVPIASFARIIIVYNEEGDAERAKLQCDPLTLEATYDRPQTILRVYRSAPNPLLDNFSAITDDQYLRPPPIEKNFLISPPGSPPVGWEPIKEEPPNPTPLADDLMAALRKLQLQTTKRSSREILLEPEDGVGVSVYVEECDFDDCADESENMDWAYGEPSPARMKWAPIPTSLPPLRMTA
jgi:hypothetical protein